MVTFKELKELSCCLILKNEETDKLYFVNTSRVYTTLGTNEEYFIGGKICKDIQDKPLWELLSMCKQSPIDTLLGLTVCINDFIKDKPIIILIK